MERRVIPLACAAAALLLAVACAPKRPAYDALYARLVEAPDLMDSSVLEGRRIVIDPGHGGCFDGVVGADSLREADVNLGVALYLWGLLKEAGADVELTRTSDRDFSDGDAENLRLDLETRTSLANSFEPEVFISIHHNSVLPLDRERNRVEIYYRSTDPNASAELANDIHTHLARNLGIEHTEIKPASYHVLRNSTAAAAVLCEASYLSNPRVEEKLKLSAKQRLEGEAYFLGLVSYFSRGIPGIERLGPAADTLDAPSPLVFAVRPGAGVPIDPATAEVSIDGRTRKPYFDASASILRCALDPDAPNGRYEILCSVRSVKGGTGTSKPFTILLSRPPRFVLPLQPSTAPEGRVYLSVKTLDRNGCPVADGTRVRLRSLATGRLFEGQCMGGVFGFEAAQTEISSAFVAELPGLLDTLRFDRFGLEEELPLLVVDASTGGRVPSPLAVSETGGWSVAGDARGLLLLPAESAERAMLVSATGYRVKRVPAGAAGGTLPLDPAYGEALRGLRVAIDPAGGGSDDQGVGGGKSRGAAVNMETAGRLAAILSGGGAVVGLTRRGEETISVEERIYKINRFGPDLALRISLAEEETRDCALLHYPGSERGMALAGELAARLGGLPPCETWRLEESAERFLQQTSCPAVEIRHGAIAHGDIELIFSNPLYPMLEAERIAAAVIALNGESPLEQTVRILMNGEPIEGAAVSIDQALTQITDSSGDARFACAMPGEHLLTVALPGETRARLATISVTDGSPVVVSLEP